MWNNRKKLRSLLRVATVAVGAVIAAADGDACTSAIVGGEASANGRMLLWKHRDSGHPHNYVARVDGGEGRLAFVGLFNAEDRAMREVWAGVNEAGFGVMNTASYNLAPDTAKVKDREGLVMAEALAACRTVGDFTKLLDGKLATGEPLGVQANFGAIDADGNGIYVEAYDHGYKVYDLRDEPAGVMVRSNYSYSGGDEGRLGEVRHDDAVELLKADVAARSVTPQSFTEGLSRSFYNAAEGKDMLAGGTRWIEDRGEMIPRRSSCASVVIESGRGDEQPVMWVAIGFPVFSPTVKVTLDDVPVGLRPTGNDNHAPLCDEAVRKRDLAMPRKGKSGKWLFDRKMVMKLLREERGKNKTSK